jgi:DNA modification methylase
MELNKVYAEDCFVTMEKMIEEGIKVNNIITSPFYNTCRATSYHKTQKSRDNYEGRYDVHLDDMTDEQYIDFTIRLFEQFDKILEKNGCILYNMSYGSENTHLMWFVVSDVIRRTNFTIADNIIWKKKSALPNNVSPNKLTRITENVLVFCRKDEFKTFEANKEVTSVRPTGQKMYANYFNFIEARNNDGANKLNKATYSTDLILQLMNIYVKPDSLVYDPFSGTCTTQNACIIYGCDYIGSELSKAQVTEGEMRINKTRESLNGNRFKSWDEYINYINN